MASTGLIECWRDAMAAKPSGWRLMGTACGPRANPEVRGAEEWCAWAHGPGGRLEGRGKSPEDAMLALTVELKKLGA